MLLSVEQVTKVFGTNTAVDRASFEVERPAMIGIIGRSGAGKSTLLRMMNRLTDATQGAMRFMGRDILALRGAEMRAWQADCAMIFQQFNLVPRMDVVSNVLHGTLNRRSTAAVLFNLWPRADILRAIDILERLGSAEQGPKRAEALSGGQQQRVAIARALMQDPKIILADEPIASLDPMNAQVVMETLRRIHDEDGRTVIENAAREPEVADLAGCLVAMGALLGGLNTMYAAFASRIREFGMLRVLGYARAAIVIGMLQEATIASMAGTLVAVSIGMSFLDGVSIHFSMGTFGIIVDHRVVAVGLLAGLATGVLGCIAPAVRCLRTEIPAALKAD